MMEEACCFEAEISASQVAEFARLSGDFNPMHMDAEYARTTEFGRPIVHGAFLVGLVSRVLGMYIPGRRSLILSMKVGFPKPLFFPSIVRVEGRLKHFNQERQTGLVSVIVKDTDKLWNVAEAEVLFVLHATSDAAMAPKLTVPAAVSPGNSCRRLLVTGGTGGIGTGLMPALLEHYEVVCVSRSAFPPSGGRLRLETVDIEHDDEFESLLNRLSPADFYGVVHMSAPPMSRGFISDDLELVRRHWRHAVEATLLLARWARRPESAVKRLVLLGSTAGSLRPQPQVGAYSLGKASLDHLARLLAADLAARGATVNVVRPSLIPVGMNEGLAERTRKTLAGRMPTRRLVETSDLAPLILFLLSDGSAQINGSSIAVDGGLGE